MQKPIPLFKWSSDLSVGIEEFDSHHKRLIQLINDLNDAISAGNEATATREVLTELTNYTMYHFFAEEEAMQKYGYPGYQQHRQEHIALIEKTLGFVQDWHRGETGLGREVLEFLKGWLMHHILHTDKKYIPFFHANDFTERTLEYEQ
jgi:hemerythrin